MTTEAITLIMGGIIGIAATTAGFYLTIRGKRGVIHDNKKGKG